MSSADYLQSASPLSLKELLERFQPSQSVRTILLLAQKMSEAHQQLGELGTGLLLLAILEHGGGSAIHEGMAVSSYAPLWLAKRIDSAGLLLEIAKREFFARNLVRAGELDSARREYISPNLTRVFELAKTLPQFDDILAARHLVVALLLFEPPATTPSNAHRILEQAGIDRTVLLTELMASLARDADEEERPAWAKLAHARTKDSEQVRAARAASSVRPGYQNDSATGAAMDDCLDLDATVNALANLIASPQLDGGLSVGVFGNWGSGKSFFMRRLRAAIAELSARGRRAAERDELAPPIYWPNIVQAEFNAWHYIDSNLWASLVSHLLQELRQYNPSPQGDSSATPLSVAVNRLQVAANARDAAEQVKQEATSAREQARSTLDHARAAVDEKIAALVQESARSIWERVDEQHPAEREQLTASLSKLGVELGETDASFQQLYARLKELGSLGGQLHVLAVAIVRSSKTRTRLYMLAALAVAPVVMIALLSALDSYAWLRNGAAWFATTFAGGVAALTQAVQWLRVRAVSVQQALAPLNAAKLRIESALERAHVEKQAEITKREKELALKEAELVSAQANAVAREQELRTATDAVKDTLSGKTITRFIEQRLASSDYQKHLGLVSLIRNDFEELSKLISGHNARRLKLEGELQRIREELHQARPSITNDIERSLENLGVNRIVLFIDDLDRCPSERVVEVLQAIHLLLAFPVFVVIVGVDARWMAHALEKEYPTLLERTRVGAPCSNHVGTVSSSDYLEKIFQIPYWVPPLTATSTSTLLGRLLARDPSVLELTRTAAETSVQLPPITEGRHSEPPSAPNKDVTARASGEPHDIASLERAQSNELHVSPVALHLNAEERAAMREMASIIGRSPRATKRFVNSYRLLKASLTSHDRTKLGIEEERLAGMATPMLMLAVITGAPSLAESFLHLPVGDTIDLLQHLSATVDDSLTRTHAPDAIRRVRDFCRIEQPRWSTPVNSALANVWATRAAQFSFEDLFSPDSPPADDAQERVSAEAAPQRS